MNILITGGPTWSKIDDVRVLTNIFTGKTALFLARNFAKRGCRVTLLINPHCIAGFPPGVKRITFRDFEGLKEKLETLLKKNTYDAVIHCAAVSDYKVKKVSRGKIPSGKKELVIKLAPTPKLIAMIRKLAKKSLLIQFKLEVQRSGLFKKAYRSLQRNKSDGVVANALQDLKVGYKAFIIDKERNIVEADSKKSLATNLYKLMRHAK